MTKKNAPWLLSGLAAFLCGFAVASYLTPVVTTSAAAAPREDVAAKHALWRKNIRKRVGELESDVAMLRGRLESNGHEITKLRRDKVKVEGQLSTLRKQQAVLVDAIGVLWEEDKLLAKRIQNCKNQTDDLMKWADNLTGYLKRQNGETCAP